MPYINDVFISYKRGRINEQWLNEIFLPYFSDYLNNALPYEPKIFVDKSGLTPGVDFSNELFRNLLYSKCLVSIWSPPYFRRSDWCLKEFLTMKYREQYMNLSADTIPQTLIWPVLYREITPMPDLVSKITYLDYSDFNVVGEAFFRTEKFLAFQEKLQSDINTISNIIVNVPPLSAEWDTPDGRKQVLRELNQYLADKCELETIPSQKPISW